VIPEAAVEAAVIAMYGQARKDNKTLHKAMRLVLEAAAPFMRQAFFLEMNLKAVAEELAAPPIRPCR